MIAFLKKRFSNNKQNKFSMAPKGIRSNCLVDQEYEDLTLEKYKGAPIAAYNATDKHAFIQDSVVMPVNGIRLKSNIHGLKCLSC